jgi:hypothetical protein
VCIRPSAELISTAGSIKDKAKGVGDLKRSIRQLKEQLQSLQVGQRHARLEPSCLSGLKRIF